MLPPKVLSLPLPEYKGNKNNLKNFYSFALVFLHEIKNISE